MYQTILFFILFSFTSILNAQVSKTVNINAGNLISTLTEEEINEITNLKIVGNIDARDFSTMSKKMPNLKIIDLSAIKILSYTGAEGPYPSNNMTYPADAIPTFAFIDMKRLELIILPYEITHIGNYAFRGCIGLKSITIPSLVTSIGNRAFSQCTGLSSVIIPESVILIKERAFSGCTGLSSISIPSSVVSIESEAFWGCSGSFNVNSENPKYSSIGGVLFNKTKTVLLQSSITNSGSYIIPSSVTEIGNIAFYGCSELTSISIPSSVKSIGSEAFSGCTKLSSIAIPSSVNSIGSSAFSGCKKLSSVIIPPSVVKIESYTFTDCISLTSISLPLTLKSIEDEAFSNCNGLTSISIPTSVNYIGNRAFENCINLSSVKIPYNVSFIGEYAFSNCGNLNSLTIPSSVIFIGTGAFKGCSKLTSIYVNLSYPINLDYFSSNSVFYEINKKVCILYVPYSAKKYYSVSPQWKDFVNIVENSEGFILDSNEIVIDVIDGSTAIINIKANVAWTVNSDQPWLKVTPQTGLGNDTLNFEANGNKNNKERTAKVTISAYGLDPQTITIIQRDLFAEVLTSNVTCYNEKNGSINVNNVKGGSGNYEFSIDGGINWQSNSIFTELSVGSYLVCMRDANYKANSSVLGTFEIKQPDIFNVQINTRNVTNSESNDGLIYISKIDEDSNLYEYSLNGLNWVSSSMFFDLVPNIYDIWVQKKNAPNCSMKFQRVVQVAGSMNAELFIYDRHFWNDSHIIIKNASGGSGSYQYSIDGGETWQNSMYFYSLAAGNYKVMLRDSIEPNTKILLGKVTLFSFEELEFSFNTSNETFKGAGDASIVINNVKGGSGNYEYMFNNTFVGKTNSFYELSAGFYQIGVIDSNNGLMIARLIYINSNDSKPPIANAGSDQTFIGGSLIQLDGSSSIDPEGDELYFNWTAPEGINLNSTTLYKPTFIAPHVKNDTVLVFTLVVNDGVSNSSPSSVKIFIKKDISSLNNDLILTRLKIYPNPTHSFIIINTGNYKSISGYTTRINNMLGQKVYENFTDQQELKIDVNTFGGYGTYIVQIIDNTSKVIATRKIILN